MVDLDRLKATLSDLPIHGGISATTVGNRIVLGVDGITVSIDNRTTLDEAAVAVRKAVKNRATSVIPMIHIGAFEPPPLPLGLTSTPTPPPAPSIDVLPRPVPVQPEGKTRMGVTGSGSLSTQLKELMAQHRKLLAEAQADMVGAFGELGDGVKAVTGFTKGVRADAAEIRAAVGQFSNDPTGEHS